MQWGSDVEFLEDTAIQTGEIPQALQNRPVLSLWIEEYVQAFDILSISRQSSFDRGPISFGDIHLYAFRYDIEDFPLFCRMIQIMDVTYLNYYRKLAEEKKK